ncbi:MAG: M20 family metallopeptidase [Janthinobacterium lividum]
MDELQNTETIWRLVEAKQDAFIDLSDRIWEIPELNFQEAKSARAHAEMLTAQGFRVSEGLAGIPTAVMGEAGQGGPVIAILGEYDALPGLSQEAGVAEHTPLPGNGPGHGCGHNLLGAGAMLAATAVKDWLAEQGIEGRVRYYGCPAEEGGAAKTFMVRDGLFDDVDIAISWHPAAFAGVNDAYSLAILQVDYGFIGRAAHAAEAPELGRSGLDAAELMNIGVNYLREHMPSSARIHYAHLESGGVAPNVVQATTTLRYIVRAADLPSLMSLAARVDQIAEGAALMTETRMERRVVSGMSNLLGNRPLEQAMFDNLQRLGPPPFDAADRSLAEGFRKSVGPADIVAAHERAGMTLTDAPLCDRIVPLDAKGNGGVGSTDVGDVSWAVPTVQMRGATYAIGTPGHSWQLTGQGKSALAHKGMVHAAKTMAGTAIDVLADPALLDQAKADHRARLAVTPYVSPLPADLAPVLTMAE